MKYNKFLRKKNNNNSITYIKIVDGSNILNPLLIPIEQTTTSVILIEKTVEENIEETVEENTKKIKNNKTLKKDVE